jgi:hypothetical protein
MGFKLNIITVYDKLKKTKIWVWGLMRQGYALIVLAALVAYVIWFVGNPYFSFVVFLPFVVSILILFLLIKALLLLTNLVVRSLPQRTKALYQGREGRLRAIILTCILLFLVVGLVMNRRWLQNTFGPLSLIADAGLLFLTVLLGRSLLRPTRVRVLALVSCVVAFSLYMSVLASSGRDESMQTARNLKAVKTLPYLNLYPAEETLDMAGVTHNDEDLCCEGLNLYHSLCSAYLIDMSGNVVNQWSIDLRTSRIDHVEMCDNGDLLCIVKLKMLAVLGWDSGIKWMLEGRFHHDVAIGEDGGIYALTRKGEIVSIYGVPMPMMNEYIVIYSPTREITQEMSLYGMLKGSISPGLYFETYKHLFDPRKLAANIRCMIGSKRGDQYDFGMTAGLDLIHANTIEVVCEDFNDILRKGNIIICSRSLDQIAVIDPERARLVWSWGEGVLEKPHHPTVLENGNILIFDNGPARGYSRVIELNPVSEEIVWEYKSEPPQEFYTVWAGANERLPNGNTLITNSSDGQVFEVTEDGRIVWEFYNPDINRSSKERAAIWRMMRITDPDQCACLRAL